MGSMSPTALSLAALLQYDLQYDDLWERDRIHPIEIWYPE
jgi:hypothetical protein